MENKRYIISEASSKTGLEPHVLRYWEDELGLEIERNELGHRYYSEAQINLLCRVKEMKQKGFQLKAIKAELMEGQEYLAVSCVMPPVIQTNENETRTEDKMDQFKAIIAGIVAETLRENNVILGQELSDTVGNKVIKEMDYLLRMKDEAEEERYKKLDEAIRSCQKNNKEAAASKEQKKRKKKKLFGIRRI